MGSSLNKIVGRSAFVNCTPSNVWPLASQLVGVELELEGLGGAESENIINKTEGVWSYHNDGSLRNGGIEMVLSTPLMGNELSDAITLFFRDNPTFRNSSARASSHVHLNMLQNEDTVEVLRNLCAFYYAIEDAMYAVISESRKWAVYASPLSSNFPYEVALLFSEQLPIDTWIRHLQQTTKTDTNNGRHYGFNLKAMSKYGTVEFRHFPAVTSEQELRSWINLCMEIKKVAVTLDNNKTTVQQCFDTEESFDKMSELMPMWGQRLLSEMNRAESLVKIQSLYELMPVVPKYSGNMGSYEEHPLFKDSDKIPKSKRTAKKGLFDEDSPEDEAARINRDWEAFRTMTSAPAGRIQATTATLSNTRRRAPAGITSGSTVWAVRDSINTGAVELQAAATITDTTPVEPPHPPLVVSTASSLGRGRVTGLSTMARHWINVFERAGFDLALVVNADDGRVIDVINSRSNESMSSITVHL